MSDSKRESLSDIADDFALPPVGKGEDEKADPHTEEGDSKDARLRRTSRRFVMGDLNQQMQGGMGS